jgi:Arc/MetJ-type ribon-helix-helix transcriptional regulator
MDPTEKIIVRLTQDTILLLQTLVDRGEYGSLSEGVSDAIDKMIGSKLTPKEITKILGEHIRERPLNMESLLTDGDPESLDEALRRAVRDYVRTRIEPEE